MTSTHGEAPVSAGNTAEASNNSSTGIVAHPAWPSIRIDPEFRDLIPPLTPDEYAGLEASIKREGCYQPLVLWDGILVDGHNRLKICNKNSLPYTTIEMDFPDRLAAQIWILMNQLGRRSLSKTARIDLANLLKNQLAMEAQVRMRAGKKLDPVETLPQGTGRTRDRVAALAGVSGKTLEKYEKVIAEGTPELVAAVRANKISINAAAKAVKASLPVEQVKVVTESEPAQDVTSDTKVSWAVWAKNKWIARVKYADHVVVTKRTINGEVLFEVEYEHCKRKDKVQSLRDAKDLGELFIGWRVEAARRAGR